ncbi:MAG: stage II sporulation protein M [Tenericutes bacterium]|nr:stage II sporulation protein M [Mycoplasmatota bacterium]
MKELFKKLKTKKLFILVFAITLLCFIAGMLLISMLSKSNKELIINSLNNFYTSLKENKISSTNLLYKTMTSNLILNIIIWVLGISIIGIPIVIFILGFKSLSLGFTISSLIYTYKFNGLLKAIIYLIPNIINIFIVFILVYYSISFSINLFNYLFRKIEFNKRVIVKRYLKLLIVAILLSILTSVTESFILPKLFNLT